MDIPHVFGLAKLVLVVDDFHPRRRVHELGDLLPLVCDVDGTLMCQITGPLPVMTGHPGGFMDMALKSSFHNSKLA